MRKAIQVLCRSIMENFLPLFFIFRIAGSQHAPFKGGITASDLVCFLCVYCMLLVCICCVREHIKSTPKTYKKHTKQESIIRSIMTRQNSLGARSSWMDSFSGFCMHSSMVFGHSPKNISAKYHGRVSLLSKTETKTSSTMDSLNFFFGLKAVRTPYVSDIPISETAIGNMSKHETTSKEASLKKELLKEEKITLINQEKQPVND